MAIIEIKDYQDFNLNFTELDDKICESESEMYYQGESIYIFQHNDLKSILVSFGNITNIDHSEITYSGNINSESEGSPIFNSFNNKLIGIDKTKDHNYYNKGLFLKLSIKEFIYRYQYRNKINLKNENKNHFENEINIEIKITKDDIYTKIYFLDNYEYKDKEGNKHSHDNLKELNKNNTELYLNKIKKDFQKYFIPEKAGTYNIEIKFDTILVDCSYMFAECENIININFIRFNTKNVRNMKYMFHSCQNLNKLNLFSFHTKNVIDMSDMFSYCIYLTSLDLTSFYTKNVVNMDYMFYNCYNLTNLYLSNSFITKKVSNKSYILQM